ncbi:PREDICTED: kinesin-like protein KIN-7E [Camelina sativa]|uniref:Kinesin-like protein n=1 Tax=Camelina sativa TaxID=90675 RepID=A0ABM0WJU9_CAMSA|nr:PREDICTED: kinesin-like protein KIN-7E [Camelina sativa]XP_010472111.1 PREDICTED: kinesin-like protein KIN-7E [Camelina sativa]XP_019093849.1 PREDICTED: kinesin-like protein KIN-7E [Camelina sativa]
MGAIAGEELKKMEKTQVHVAREEKILVLVRLRPLNEKEILANEAADWECINDTTVLYRNTLREGSTFPSAYSFDRVYRGECPTRQVYEDGPKEVALSVVKGINSSIFAYGQTSSGKTYTMSGITEFAVADIFDYIFKNEDRAFVVKFSAIEIYNEAIRDLLSPDSTPLRLRDDPEKGAVVEKATEETLRDWNHLKDLISVCEAQRKIGETSLNERSSRSHQIIKLTVESSAREFLGKENSTTLMASVNFIDLAGSERASQALSAGARLKEGCHINRSLLTLGTVIRKLSNGRQGHINYRDSKLTRILQPCLGGNARTAIVCTLSPARSHVEQTRNTLLFACCAKEVTTKAQINVVMSDKALVKQLQRELARLESELRNPAPATLSCDCGVALRKKDLQIQKMEKQLAEMTKRRDIAQSRLDDFMKMVEHDESSKAGAPHNRNRTNKWEDGSVSETSGVVDPDRTSFISDGTSTPLSTARAHVRSHSDDLEEELSSGHLGDQSEEYCKEVQCIEMDDESTSDINNNSEERTDAETILGHNTEANGGTGHAQNSTPSSVRSVRRRQSWSRGETMPGTSTPPDALEMDYPGRPEVHGIVFPDLEFGSGGKLLREDSMSSRGSDSTEAHSVGTPLVGDGGGITSIRSFVEGLKEMVSDTENSGKMGKDIGVDAMEEEVSGTMTNWSDEFERQREQILGLWQTCHVSLVHRTYFFLLFTGDQADSIYIGVELRRLSFMKESFSQGNHAFERGQTLTVASSLKALHRERRMLSKLVGKRFTGEERKRLYQKFGIAVNSKRRRLQLANQLWSKPNDITHVVESAAVVAKLVRFVEQGRAMKEMFSLSFTPPLPTTRRSLNWRKSMATLF